MKINCAGKQLDLSGPIVMGILNVTPDSFSDGGRFDKPGPAVSHAQRLAEEGAAIIDVGGESTRPGAAEVSEAEELDRVIPVIELLRRTVDVPISIDTRKAIVMREAVKAGAGLINDVSAMTDPGALAVCRENPGVAICLMHMQGTPRNMQAAPRYTNVVAEVKNFLSTRTAVCRTAGIPAGQIIIDPGFGFGKTLQHNLQLLNELDEIAALRQPVLVGMSRKSMIGQILSEKAPVPGDQRLFGSLAAAVMAAQKGAKIIRAHDVKATVDALRVVAAALRMDSVNSV